MAQTQFESDLYVNGNIACRTLTIPDSTVTNAKVSASAAIAATKLEHQFPVHYSQAPGSAIVAATTDLHIVYGATGTIVQFEAAITGSVTAGDYTATLDLQKSTGGGSFASVLSASLVLDSANTIRVPESATLSSTSLVDGDILRLVVTVAGTTGSQSQGLIARVFLREVPA